MESLQPLEGHRPVAWRCGASRRTGGWVWAGHGMLRCTLRLSEKASARCEADRTRRLHRWRFHSPSE
ncbi:hypothetical protein TRAPUB_13184 [Trametes pubescens]|uniref:Uncharacterized protein n=1 Tax=Trametes pubescens TaxID=154538 RepID=A0A1M2VRW4_TRAPU|nr:hypothetical protein TRAPUB_13184 [Trametes pubescens]